MAAAMEVLALCMHSVSAKYLRQTILKLVKLRQQHSFLRLCQPIHLHAGIAGIFRCLGQILAAAMLAPVQEVF